MTNEWQVVQKPSYGYSAGVASERGHVRMFCCTGYTSKEDLVHSDSLTEIPHDTLAWVHPSTYAESPDVFL